MNLEDEFRQIQDGHRQAIVARVVRVCFSGSTGRVLPSAKKKGEKSASAQIKEVLRGIDVDALPKIENQEKFKAWFEEQLDKVAKVIPGTTSKNKRLTEGARRWGYAAKILCLYLRDVVEHCRYFTPEQAEKARQWLYCPIDKTVMDKMRECGENLSFKKIKEIDTEDLFYDVQKRLGEAADKVGVPRIWFDDNWGGRQ